MNSSPTLEEFPFDEAVRFADDDDRLHPWGPNPDWVETAWFSFNVPERSLAGWLYTQVRPNLGTVSGGAFVYDATAHEPWELPYLAYFEHQPLAVPAEEIDLTSVTFRNGVSIERVEMGMVYDLHYAFRDQTDFVADLRFSGLTPPVPHLHGAPPFVGSSHYDQHGRVTGALRLHGEDIEVDCFAVRDRSWGRRPELIGPQTGRLSYVFGTFGPADAFLAFCRPEHGDQTSLVETMSTGYLMLDGRLRRLESARRVTARDPDTGGVATIELDLVDLDGRRLVTTGATRAQMFLSRTGLCINSLLEFDAPGTSLPAGYGEDQDLFSLARFSDLRRGGWRRP